MTTWRAIPGYDGVYEVSDQGDFRSARGGKIRFLAVTFCRRHGYGYISLSKIGQKTKKEKIHRAVLLAFGFKPTKLRNQARHLDGIKTHNWLSNLKWGTALENHADKVLHGRNNGAWRGQKHHNAKLTDAAVKKIRVLLREGFYQRDIAQLFGVTQSNISKIATGISRQSQNATKRAEMRL